MELADPCPDGILMAVRRRFTSKSRRYSKQNRFVPVFLTMESAVCAHPAGGEWVVAAQCAFGTSYAFSTLLDPELEGPNVDASPDHVRWWNARNMGPSRADAQHWRNMDIAHMISNDELSAHEASGGAFIDLGMCIPVCPQWQRVGNLPIRLGCTSRCAANTWCSVMTTSRSQLGLDPNVMQNIATFLTETVIYEFEVIVFAGIGIVYLKNHMHLLVNYRSDTDSECMSDIS
jgi:hypothetical protein